MITKINNKVAARVLSFLFPLSSFLVTGCDDFFKQESSDVLYDDVEHLDKLTETNYSLAGILGKLQVVADRTVLLGEVRGDLVDLTVAANSDLRDVANFTVGDDNRYNYPSDYYAVINNCNYFLAHADTTLHSSSNLEPVFMAEYAAVKSIRAWTYLQLALNYGRVPLVTEPLLSSEAAEAAEKGATADIVDVCSFFLNDLATIPAQYNTYYPLNQTVNTLALDNNTLLFFPLSLMRAELYLWRASVNGSVEDYRQAALQYFQFISERNGQYSAYPTETEKSYWSAGAKEFNWSNSSLKASYNDSPISVIACNSSRVDGVYSELRDLFCSTVDNNYKMSIVPSQRIIDISAAQDYCLPALNGQSATFVPKGLTNYQSGDLRLYNSFREGSWDDEYTREHIRTQTIYKHQSRNVVVYRRVMVYLHLAEALNGAGYPRMAFLILSKGLSNKVIKDEAMPYYKADGGTDSLFLARFDFNDSRYEVSTVQSYIGTGGAATINQLGIHSRGSGWTPMNSHYVLPNDTIETDAQKHRQLVAEQQLVVDSLLLNEEALELAFEGTRYYDLMRFALRSDNPAAFMSSHVYARRGEDKQQEVQALVKADFADRSNWFLRWNGKIGY